MSNQAQSIIVVDVGNSTTVVGVAQVPTLVMGPFWSISTRADRTPDEWQSTLMPLMPTADFQAESIAGAVIASVVPQVTRSLASMIREWFGVEPLIVDSSSNLGLAVDVDQPLDVGADRLVNAVAVRHLVGNPAVVVDAGTATKVDVVSADGAFLGGAIAPGIGVGVEALAARAARLYAVEIAPPRRAIGRTTVEAIQSGLVFGHVAMVEGMVARIRTEIDARAPVVVTGGYGRLLASLLDIDVRLEPNLTRLGAALVWMRETMGVVVDDNSRLR